MQFSSLYTQYVSDFANPNQVLFINQSGSAILDDFFRGNPAKVKSFFRSRGKDFIYLPSLLTPEYVNDLVRYTIPHYPEILLPHVSRSITPDNIYNLFMNFKKWRELNPHILFMDGESQLGENVLSAPHTGLVTTISKDEILPLTDCKSSNYSGTHTDAYDFATLEEADEDGIWEQLHDWADRYSPAYLFSEEYEVLYNMESFVREKITADESFSEEAYQLSQEILERVEKLRLMGVNELIIKGLLETTPQISPLLVTRGFQILLPEYGNREIVMTPLVKAVYLLFLKHPEGIMFKRISEWGSELLDLYSRCSGREPDMEMRQSVDNLVDPLNNSLNEKCSRIREAFLREMDDSMACHYYITGSRATPKRIILDRRMVKWEETTFTSEHSS